MTTHNPKFCTGFISVVPEDPSSLRALHTAPTFSTFCSMLNRFACNNGLINCPYLPSCLIKRSQLLSYLQYTLVSIKDKDLGWNICHNWRSQYATLLASHLSSSQSCFQAWSRQTTCRFLCWVTVQHNWYLGIYQWINVKPAYLLQDFTLVLREGFMHFL